MYILVVQAYLQINKAGNAVNERIGVPLLPARWKSQTVLRHVLDFISTVQD